MIFDFLRQLALDGATVGEGTASGTDTSAPGGLFGAGSPWIIIVYVVVIAALFYFMLYRPQKKKDKEKKSMLESMKKGDKVTTIGGLQGRIAQIKDDTIVIDVATVGGAEKVKIEVQRWAIGSVDTKDETED